MSKWFENVGKREYCEGTEDAIKDNFWRNWDMIHGETGGIWLIDWDHGRRGMTVHGCNGLISTSL
jgi:hypothetical protein